MKKEIFCGNGIEVCAMPTTMMNGFIPVCGTMFYLANEEKKYENGGDGIWVMDLAKIQNADAFMQGIKYVSQMASNKNREICWDILKKMAKEPDKGSEWYVRMIAFFCDLGLWKKRKLCQPDVWHKDFPKYLANNLWNYYIV